MLASYINRGTYISLDPRFVMKEVMSAVVTDVAKDPSAKDVYGDIPVPVKYKVCKSIEGCSEDYEQSGRHNKAEFVHR